MPSLRKRLPRPPKYWMEIWHPNKSPSLIHIRFWVRVQSGHASYHPQGIENPDGTYSEYAGWEPPHAGIGFSVDIFEIEFSF